MKLALRVLAALLIVLAVITIYGATLPLRHHAASMVRLQQTPEAIWGVISDFPGLQSWRTGVTGIERLPDRNGHAVWMVRGEAGSMPLEVLEAEPPRWLKAVIGPDAELSFGGSWSWQVSPADDATVVTIIEEGEIYNPLLRGLAKIWFGYHDTLDGYLIDLGRKFGEPVAPQPIPQAVLPR
jgi:hypothetical protein